MKIFFILFLIAGCAPEPKVPLNIAPDSPEDVLKAKEIWRKVEERRNTIKNNPEWIKDSYTEIKIKALANMPVERYGEYKKFLDDGGTAYVITHPAYYAFFHHPKIHRKNDSMAKNIMDLLLENGSFSDEDSAEKKKTARYKKEYIQAMNEFERIERNFLEFKSTEGKLIILILPGNYKKFASYSYKDGLDEFARYINDVTNMSESVVYLESRKPNRGSMLDEDIGTLIEFLQKVGATRVMVGGEYIGRCEEDIYRHLEAEVGTTIAVEVVPELSPPSPDDMNPAMKNLVGVDNKLDIEAATYNDLFNKYERIETKPKLTNLKSRLIYEKPD